MLVFLNTQSWHYWHFCTTSNVNNLQTVANERNSSTNLDLLNLKNYVFDNYLSFILNFKQYRHADIANLVYFEKKKHYEQKTV